LRSTASSQITGVVIFGTMGFANGDRTRTGDTTVTSQRRDLRALDGTEEASVEWCR